MSKYRLGDLMRLSVKQRWAWFGMLLTFSVGIFLRLYMLTDQVILDDEWHSIDFVIKNSCWYLFTHFTRIGATCIPLNIYRRLLLVSGYFNEITSILPSILTGISSLILFPWLLSKIFKRNIVFIFCCLTTISPLLIFYSRYGRPYMVYAFLGFLSVLYFYLWIKSGSMKHVVIYVVVSFLGIYFHLLAVVVVFAPLCFFMLLKLIDRHCSSIKEMALLEKVSLRQLFFAGAFIGLLVILFLLGPILQTITPLQAGTTHYNFATLIGLAHLLSGTANIVLTALFVLLICIGFVVLYKENPIMCLIIFAVIIGYIFTLLYLSPRLAQVPLILSRYVIPVFPVCYLLVAISFNFICSCVCVAFKKRARFDVTIPGVLLFTIALYYYGPVKEIGASPNNFTNHSAFQESYQYFSWDNPRPSAFYIPFSRKGGNLSEFYNKLADLPAEARIIEYPMMVGNHLNPFYYYQHFHKKEVTVGYLTSMRMASPESLGHTYDNYYIDFILSEIHDNKLFKFRNIIDMEDIDRIRGRGIDYIIIHNNVVKEMFPQLDEKVVLQLHHNWGRYPGADIVVKLYETVFGDPVFSDEDIIVFKVDVDPQQ